MLPRSSALLTQLPTTSPTTAQADVHAVTVTASAFPGGTIDAAAVSIVLVPVTQGAAPVVVTRATRVTTVAGTTRRVTFTIPPRVVVTEPTPYQVIIAGVSSVGAAFQTLSATTLVVNPPALIAGVEPSRAATGSTVAVAIAGQFTDFVNGATRASFGPGVSVGGAPPGELGLISVTSPTRAVAQLLVDSAAALGPRRVLVRTGPQEAALESGFVVVGTPSIVRIEPGSGLVGQQDVAVQITGQDTNFSGGETQIAFGAGITVSGVDVRSPTSLVATIVIAKDAVPGPRTVSATTGSEVASLSDGFLVQPAPAEPALTQIDIAPAPTATITKGQTLQLSARGTFSNGTIQDPLAGAAWNIEGVASTMATYVYVADGISRTSAYRADAVTGGLTPIPGSPFSTGSVPTGVVVDPTARFVYVSNYSQVNEPLGTVWGFAIDRNTGALTPLPGSPFQAGARTYYLSVAPSGRFLYATNVGDHTVSVYAIHADTGVLTPVPGSPFAVGLVPYIVAITPDSRFAYVANAGSNSISAFSVEPSTGALAPVPGSPFPSALYPGNIAITPSGRRAYVVNFGNNGPGANIAGFDIDPATGALTPIPGSPFSSVDWMIGVVVEPGERYAFVSVAGTSGGQARLEGGIKVFAIDPVSGALTPETSGLFPSRGNCTALGTLAVTGRFFYAPNCYSNTVSGFQVGASGSLGAVIGSPFSAGTGAWSVAAADVRPATTEVASVNSTGLVTALAPGTARIRASFGSVSSAPTTLTVKPVPPDIAAPILAGATTVSGTGAEPGATVQVFVNGLPRGPTETAGDTGTWAAAGLAPVLAVGDNVTARQTANGVLSDVSTPVVVDGGPPSLLAVVPNTGMQGQQHLNVTIAGRFTKFAQGVSQASFGPGISVAALTIVDSVTALATVNVAPTSTLGPRTVVVSTGSETATLVDGFHVVAPTNLPPVVNAGPDQSITLPGFANLFGSVSDDGVPTGQAPAVTWRKISGPGTVTFASPLQPVTAALFSSYGTYVLRLEASDGLETSADDVMVNVDPCLTGRETNVFNIAALGALLRLPDGRLRTYVGNAAFGPVKANNLTAYTSTDGLSWQVDPSISLALTGSVYAAQSATIATLQDGRYRMYFMGDYQSDPNEWRWQIYSALSADGVTWTLDPGIRVEHGAAGCLHLGAPEIVALPGGGWRLFYSCSSTLATAVGNIVSATSMDGLAWTPDPGIRVALSAAYFPTIVKTENGSYRMFLTTNTSGFASARSSDLLNWTIEANTRLGTGAYPTDSDSRLGGSKFVMLPDSTYRLFYTGYDAAGVARMLSARWCSLDANNPPTVNAGPDQTIAADAAANLTGIGVDDGLPSGAALSYEWRVVSGPAGVTFADTHSAFTTARFDQPGGYKLRLIVADGTQAGYDDVNILVTSPTAPIVVSVTPSSIRQGEPALVTITGLHTHFTQGVTAVALGAGITVNSVVVTGTTSLTAAVGAADDAALGSRAVSVTTAGEVVSWNGFVVIEGAPRLASITPSVSAPGATATLEIVGRRTHFAAGGTQVSLGDGVAIEEVVVEGFERLFVRVRISATAAIGPRTVVVTSFLEQVTLTDGFMVAGTPAPSISQVAPAFGPQGQSGPVAIVGSSTHFVQGVTTVDLGPGITVNSVTVTCATCLEAHVTIADDASPGSRTVTVTTATEVAALANGFTVQPGTPMLTSLSRASGSQGQSFPVTITGRFTHFEQGVTQVDLGTGIVVSAIVVSSPTSLSAQVAIDAIAAPGTRTLTVTTTSEAVLVNNVFTVSLAAALTRIDLVPAGTVTLTKGQGFQFSAKGTFADNSVQDPLAGVTWGSDKATVASVTATGLATAIGSGIAHITAAKTGVESAATNFVVQPVPVGLFAPITAGETLVSGAVAEPGGAVQVFVNGLPRGPSAIANSAGDWSVSGLTPALVVGDSVTARQTANGVQSDVSNPIVVTAGPPSLLSVTPSTGTQGQQNLNVTIAGQDTHFAQGASQISFQSSTVAVNSVTVASPTSLTANISIAPNASTVPRTVTVTTGSEVVARANAFTVLTATNQAPTITIASTWAAPTLPGRLILTYTVTDDGFPAGGALTTSWERLSGPGTAGFLNQTSTSISVGFDQVGVHVLRVTATDTQLTTTRDVTVTVSAAPTQPPVVSIATPTEGTEVTSRLNVIGSVTSSALASWTLEFRMSSEPAFRTLATGTTPVTNGVLGTFDPTLLLNGIAEIRLRATDVANQNATFGPVSVVVTQNQKIGNFTVSFNDLTVPVAGLPIQVIRTYDSRDKRVGDFGVGWQLDLKTVSVTTNGPVGESWTGTATGGLFPNYCIQPAKAHVVTIAMSDGTIYQFQPTLTPACQQLVPLSETTVAFVPISTTPPNASLAVVGSATAFVPWSQGAMTLMDLSQSTTFDPVAYRLTLPDGRVLVISKQTGLQTLTDLNGNSLTVTPGGIVHSSGKNVTFQRDGANRITRVTDPAGHAIEYTYDTSGDLISVKDQTQNTTTFTYNGTHGLLTIHDPRGVQPIRNVYDDSGRLVQHIDAFGKTINYTHNLDTRQEIVTDRLGRVTVNEYDVRGNVVQVTDAMGGVTARTYDARNNLLSERDPLGRSRSFTYDARDNRLTDTDPLGHTTTYTYNSRNDVLSVRDPLGRVTTNAYDARSNLISTTDPAGTTTFSYDARGLRTLMTDALGGVSTFGYDASGNLTTQVDALGRTTTSSYDANGNRLTETRTQTTATGPLQVVTQYQYDALNRVIRTVAPDGTSTQTSYNTIGKPAITTDQLGRQTSYQYDDMGRLTRATFPDGTTESSTYDAEGNRVSSTDRGGSSTTYAYDGLRRLVQTTLVDGATTNTAYDGASQVTGVTDPLGHGTSYAYDAAGRRVSVTDALGQVTTMAYDAAGNQVSMTDAEGRTTQYQYDNSGRRVRTVYVDSTRDVIAYDALGRTVSKTDQAGLTTQFHYDALGRLTAVIDALNQTTVYGYDELGNRTSQTDANGHTTRFGYDALGRRTSRTLPLGMTETFTFDAGGNMVTKRDFNGRTTTYSYDTVGRLSTKTPDAVFAQAPVQFSYTAAGRRAQMVDASGTTTYAYDTRQRLVSKATPQGTLTYSYDLRGALKSMQSSNQGGTSVDYAYDTLNRLATATDNRSGSGVTSYTYTPVGSLATVTYPNTVTHAYQYDSLNRLANLTVSNAAAALASYAYTLGPTGNRTRVAELGGRRVDYSYDALYRLTNETVTGGTVNGVSFYGYDPVGNRLSLTTTLGPLQNQSLAYDANDRLASQAYDANGNTTVADAVGHTYDFENRLIGTTTGVTMVYDGDGSRIAKTVAGVTTRYLVDEQNLTGYAQVLEELVGGAVQRAYTYGLGRISQTQTSGTSIYGYDGHGSVRLLADSSGAVTDRYDYDAFGTSVRQLAATPNDYRYAGEQIDPQLELYYLRARYYKAGSGRFQTPDTFEGFGVDPPSLHLYAYVANSAPNAVDPSGNWTVADVSLSTAIQGILRVQNVVKVTRVLTSAKDKLSLALGVAELAYGAFYPERTEAGLEWTFKFRSGLGGHSVTPSITVSCTVGLSYGCDTFGLKLKPMENLGTGFGFQWNLTTGSFTADVIDPSAKFTLMKTSYGNLTLTAAIKESIPDLSKSKVELKFALEPPGLGSLGWNNRFIQQLRGSFSITSIRLPDDYLALKALFGFGQ